MDEASTKNFKAISEAIKEQRSITGTISSTGLESTVFMVGDQ